MVRQDAPAQHDRVRSGKTVVPDVDRFGTLTTRRQIDCVGEQLGTKSADRRESADSHARSAIDQVTAADSGMPFYDQLRVPLRLMRKMTARPAGKPGDPV